MTRTPVSVIVDGSADAPVVLLIGSLGSTTEMWRPQLAALAGRFRVVRYDTRGHGASSVPPAPYSIDDLVDDAIGVLDDLEVSAAHLVGLSLGGMTSLALAARHPDRVSRLAVLCTSARFPDPDSWRQRAELVRREGMAAVAGAVVARWLTPSHATADPDLAAWAMAMIASTPPEGYAACCEVVGSTDLRAELGRITAPTLVIAGADDPAAPLTEAAAIAGAVAGARLLVVDDAAHIASLDQPAVVNAALLGHLDPAGAPATDDTYRRGMTTRRAVLGDAHVDRAVAATTELTAPFQDFITRAAWGEVWSRPGLDRRSRSMVTLAILAADGHENELAMHVRSAITNGVTPAEVTEVMLHVAVYAGVPAANTALAIASRVMAGLDRDAAETGHDAGDA